MFAEVFVTLLVIMDPIGNVPVFLALTRRMDNAQRNRAALQASAVAAVVILVFAIFGERVLQLLGVSVQALQVGGGLLLLLVALELLTGSSSGGSTLASGTGESAPNVALVPLGTPLLAGPGAIAATMLFVGRAETPAEIAMVLGALMTVVVVVWLALTFAGTLGRVLKENGIILLTRIMGLLLAAIAVQLVAVAIEEWVENGVS